MITDEKEFSLRNHDQAVEMFDLAAQKAFKNMLDPNTSSDQVREVFLRMRFKPDPDTGMVTTEVSAGSKLAPQRCFREKIIIGFEGGRYTARRIKQHQPQLPLGEVIRVGGAGKGDA